MNSFSALILLLISLSVTSPLFGQTKRIEDLQEIYETEVEKVTAPVSEKYERALLNLQENYVEQNRLEDALLVKKEIEALKAGTLKRSAKPNDSPVSMPVTAPGEATAGSEEEGGLLAWKGDHEKSSESGGTIYTLEGKDQGTNMMTVSIKDVQKRFPNGMRIRFQYRSEDFVGDGVEMRGEFPDLRGLFTYRNPTLRFDGKWNEYLWPFSDTKGQELMNFQILLENGEGSVSFKKFEFLAN